MGRPLRWIVIGCRSAQGYALREEARVAECIANFEKMAKRLTAT
jgi:hypothetical protein